jgi:transcriptional regulator with XRE-family HTH domain
LREFIDGEIKRLNLSRLGFAELAGVSHTAINNLLSDNPPEPSVEFLWKIAKATDTDVISVLRLAYPDIIKNSLSAKARILAEKIDKSTPETQQMIFRLLY